ncbi:MAG: hypothetical protein VST68_13205 [Nitrospirota bacterium]|nr:hypothetical protein [Nitrospirota bacterium]
MLRMTPRLAVLLVILSFSGLPWLTGCQSTPPKYPDDHARFDRIVKAVSALETAYTKKDLVALQDLMLPVEPLDRTQLDMQNDFATFSDISLDMTIERIIIRGGHATVNIRWAGEWKQGSEPVGLIGHGHGELIWSGNQVILLSGVDGDLPFGMTSRLKSS